MSVYLAVSPKRAEREYNTLSKNVFHGQLGTKHITFIERFIGQVVEVQRRDPFITKSDFVGEVAVIWNPEGDEFTEFVFKTDKLFTDYNYATVDAPADVKEIYHNICLKEDEEKKKKEALEDEKKNFKKGDKVTCVKAYHPKNPKYRPLEKGETGTITWIGSDRFNPGRRFGIKVGPNKEDVVWVNESKVEKILN